MKRFVFIIIVISFSLLIWGCSEEIQSPTASMDSEQSSAATDTEDSMTIEDEEFDTELSAGHYGSSVEYEVTLENLTPATGAGSSQPFSPPVLATHKSGMRLFKRHHYASDELRQIAEDAVNAPMVEKLKNSRKVFDVVEGTSVIFPESSDSFIIQAKRGYNKFSLVCMLVNTNDAFSGISKAKLTHPLIPSLMHKGGEISQLADGDDYVICGNYMNNFCKRGVIYCRDGPVGRLTPRNRCRGDRFGRPTLSSTEGSEII